MTASRAALAGFAGLAGSVLVVGGLAGCTDNATVARVGGASADARALTVTATDDGCTVSAPTAPSGTLRFAVTNAGSKVNEFYLLAPDGLRIIGEIENIAPGLTRDLTVAAAAGAYFTACKPGMLGDGIRTAFAVSESGADLSPTGADQVFVAEANRQYRAYVRDQTDQLVAATDAFAAAYLARRDAEARALYPRARVHWERIETVAESFGDLDPLLDAREADLQPGQKWTGWHRIEKDLWPARDAGYRRLGTAERRWFAADLRTNTNRLAGRVKVLTYTADQIANGCTGLLDEVASKKVTGEEEHWSRTDLWDFQGNLDGARVGFDGLTPLLTKRGHTVLRGQLQARFDALQELLDAHRRGDGFVSYDHLSAGEVKALSDAVNALSEPLSKLAAAVS